MLLNDEQIELLTDDLDYILARTTCNTIQLTKGQVANSLAATRMSCSTSCRACHLRTPAG